jgi:hypothetical protein
MKIKIIGSNFYFKRKVFASLKLWLKPIAFHFIQFTKVNCNGWFAAISIAVAL